METASLKLKFTSLFQNLQQDSNHCLEIIPEITYVKNLNKLKWKKEKSYIEYIVPVTYRVILRKNESKSNEDLNRTYYSCVNFLLPSSDEIQELGNIKKILSDTFLMTNVPTNTEKCNTILVPSKWGKEKDGHIISNGYEVQQEINSYTSVVHKTPGIESFKGFDNKEKVKLAKTTIGNPTVFRENRLESGFISSLDDYKVNFKNTTKTEFAYITVPSVNKAESVFSEKKTQYPTIKSKSDAKYKLCLSPICSINTDDGKFIKSDPILNQAIDAIKNFVTLNESNNSVYHSVLEDNFYCGNFNITTQPYIPIALQPFDAINRRRILPEERIAKIVQLMEREITPLKNMLCDIISKCSSLGFTKNNLKQPFQLKNVTYSEKQSYKYCDILNKTKSNRVVYSIVFDD